MNSTLLSSGNTILLAQRFNEAVIKYIDETYPFLLEHEDLSITCDSSIAGVGVSGINVSSTKYLSDGDTVTIEGIDYVISSLITDTSFQIVSDEATNYFQNKEITYKPFYDVKFRDFNLYSII
jgi:hypothetical protein